MIRLVFVMLLISAVPMRVAFGYVPRRSFIRFVSRYPMPITGSNGAVVLQYLARVRSARAIGGLTGFAISVFLGLRGNRGVFASTMFLVMVGHLAGSIAAEVPFNRPRVELNRRASLNLRRTQDYVAAWMFFAPFAMVAATVGFLVVLARHSPGISVDRASIVPELLLAIGVALLVRSIAKVEIRRPQPFDAPSIVCIDDQLRAATIHNACGAGFALVSLLMAGVLFEVASELGRGRAHDRATICGVAATITYFSWLYLRVRPWQTQRLESVIA